MEEKIFNRKSQKEKRRYLRNNATTAEKKLWQYLRKSQLNEFKFRRQHGIGNYIVDFYCPELRLVVEVDGEIHNTKEAQEYDSERTKYLQEYNISVIRFRNQEVFNDVESVLQAIVEKAKATTP